MSQRAARVRPSAMDGEHFGAAMNDDQVFTNARIVTRDAVIEGTAVVRDGRVAAVDAGTSAVRAATDLEGDYLLPGLVELHTDNLEKHFVPRPGVDWPSHVGAAAHDAQLARKSTRLNSSH